HLTELPQGRKAARAGGLWRVREGSSRSRGSGSLTGRWGSTRMPTGGCAMSAAPPIVRGVSTALYRRYRPETFADVIGQEHVTGPLMAALDNGRVTHAYLFSGPRGCGKTTSARIFARCLNCAEGPTSTPCGTS